MYAKNDEHLMELLNGKLVEIPGVATARNAYITRSAN